MDSYRQVVEKAELALIKGEYNFCIEYLYPIIESYPPSSKEGANLRTILITALSGINKKEEAKIFCKELLKSRDYNCLLYTSPSPRDGLLSRMPSSA